MLRLRTFPSVFPILPNYSRFATKKAAAFQVHLKDNYKCLANLILLQKYFTNNFLNIHLLCLCNPYAERTIPYILFGYYCFQKTSLLCG